LPDSQLRDLLGNCAGCDMSDVDLHGKDLHGISIVGSDLSGANLRAANLSGSVLCAHSERWSRDGVTRVSGKVACADLSGADLHGTDLRGVKLCDDARGRGDCRQVDSSTLRDAAHANLSGAIGP
jgi:uncharacterized protein YjbI with pentapeptide repeats